MRFIILFSLVIISCTTQVPSLSSTFLPDNLKEGNLEWQEGKTTTQRIQELPSDIEALDLLSSGASYELQDNKSWPILKRFRNLKRLEIGGADFGLGKEFCELYDLPLESIYIRADSMDRQVSRQMHQLKNLRRLGLVVHNYHKQDTIHLGDLAKIKTLEELKTACSYISEIAKLQDCPSLKRIQLGGAGDDYAIQYAKIRQLEQICLEGSGCAVPDDDKPITKKGLEAIATLPKLKNLDLSSQKLTDEALEPLSKITTLERLNLNDCPITDKAIKHIKGLSNLKALHVARTPLTDACFEDLSALKQLEELSIFGSKTSALGMKHFKGSKLKRLTLSAVSNANLAFIPDLPSLQYLNLEAASLTEVGAKHLARCPSLISIHIGVLPDEKEKKIAILKELAKIKTLKQIKGIYSDDLPDDVLKSILPNCTTGELPPDQEALFQPLILDANSHDVTKHFGCFR